MIACLTVTRKHKAPLSNNLKGWGARLAKKEEETTLFVTKIGTIKA